MPIPTPSESEDQRGFMERCMSVVTKEMDTDQAVAVCMKQWRDSHASSARKYTRFMAALSDVRAEPAELKAASADEKAPRPRKLVGYASVFNRLSEDRGGYCYTVAPGAFSASVGKDDVRALYNHNPDYVLGRTANGTLRLAEDARGLKVEIDLPDTTFANDLHALIQRGDVTQMSFGGMVVQETRHEDGELCVYAVREFQLWDVSPVTYPAFDGTVIRTVAASAEAPAEPPKTILSALVKRRLRSRELVKTEIGAT